MQNKKSISAPKRGMNRDSHISQLKQTDYTFALNANVESEDGGILNINNEPSNYLGLVFVEGYKTIGYRKDSVLERTYLLLTNPTTRKSSIGYTDDILIETFNEDSPINCGDCLVENGLSTPLEEQTQTPSHEYIELLNDDCHIDNGDLGLNFNINFPVHNIEIKHEKGGTTIYWNDYRNEPRWLTVTDLRYLFTTEIPCEDDELLTCFDVDKLLQFPKHTRIDIQPELLQIGGQLKLGTYEFYGVYCDALGNEITNYSTPTNPISIFDENNRILTQPELDAPTNFAIKLKVNNLDTRFNFYKIVVVQITNVNNEQSYFVEGIHPTTDDIVIYSSEANKVRIPKDALLSIKTQYEKAKGAVTSDGYLFQWGLKAKREVNLQPVVNILGGFVQWQSSIAKEGLYKSAIATSKYKGFARNEVQPFAIRFYFKDGGYTANFPLVPRPATEEELEDLTYLEGDEILTDDLNLQSLWDYEPNCSNTERTKRWQVYNTATQEDVCVGATTGGREVVETVQKQCTIEDVFTIEAGTATFELEDEFISLEQYIEDNPDVEIPGITEYLEDEYEDDNCTPLFGTIYTSGELIVGATYIIYEVQTGDDFDNVGFAVLGEPFTATETTPTSWENETEVTKTTCGEITLISSSNTIGVVQNEVSTLDEIEFPSEYAKLPKPSYCYIYRTGGDGKPELDREFSFLHMYRGETFPTGRVYFRAYKREYNFSNEECSFADDIINLSDVETTLQGYFHNYYGAESEADLQTSKTATEVDVPEGFTNKIHKGALWFKGNTLGREKFILEMSVQNDASGDDDIITSSINPDQKVRVSIFDKCSSSTPLYSEIISLETGGGIQLLISDLTPTGFNVDNGTTVTAVTSPMTGGTFFVVVDTPIYEVEGKDTYEGEEDNGQGGTIITKYRLAPTDGCWSIATRDVQYSSVTVSWDSITIDKTQIYESQCSFIIPDVDDCDPIPYANGKFAYWESIRDYPDNAELYDSTWLTISEDDLEDLTAPQKKFFKDFYTTDLEENYTLIEDLNLTCKPIRHYKFPDNTVSPFLLDINIPSFTEGYIFPLGITLDNTVVETFLKIAVKNNLITQTEFDNIEGYEILKGANTMNKSVIANGLAYDMYKYEEKDKDVYYANYPHNDLGDDELHYTNNARNEFIPHPYEGEGNDKYSFISPDLLLNNLTTPTEVIFSGYQFGNALNFINEVEEHSKWTILGDKAKRLALRLAIAESLLETAVKTAEILSNQVFIFGLANGTSLGLAGSIAAAAAYSIQSFMRIGQFRYQWLEIFRNLGGKNNFASYSVSEGTHNRFFRNQDLNNYIRGLSTIKSLQDARRYSIRDEKTGEDIRINALNREYNTFLSLGEHFFEYDQEYKNRDNNKVSKDTNSRTYASRTDCTNPDSTRNIGSPYFTLKNYVPDQYGDIDSIKWLTTNYKNKLGEDSTCQTIFGGNSCISRFSWKRKIPFFSQTAFRLADRLPFNYSDYPNIGSSRFFCDYENDGEFSILGIPFPDIDSNYNFDCATSSNRMYIRKPSKFYLYYYGIASFMVESEINCNFRYGGREPKDQFHPLVGDVIEWTQEKNVSIKEPNAFFYNNVYSLPVSNTPYKFLNKTYSEEFSEIQRNQENAVIRSEKDLSQNDPTDPWLIFKPLNFNELEKKHGRLVRLVDVGSGQLMALFENGMLVFGAIDTIQKSLNNSQTQILGTGGVFTQRVLELKTTDLGFAGSQHNEVVNTPYGHFYVDAKRGKVFLYEGGNNLNTVSESAGKEPTNIKNWFKEHLPFKILRDYPTISTDNKFKGLGISLGWDERFDRVFLTKKDYIAKNKECLRYREDIGFYLQCSEDCTEGLDLVFVIDGTGSQQTSIDNIKDNIIGQILPSITSRFGTNYRLGLIVVKDRRTAGQSLFDILTPLSDENATVFETALNTVVASGGIGGAEPSDKALEAVLNNTQEIDLNGDIVISDTIGEFRGNVAKAVILITDNVPSGLDDNYTYEDWENVQQIALDYMEQNIQIFPILTSIIQPASVAPDDINEIPPNVTYVMTHYADVTNGVYSFSSLGEDISDDIVEIIEDSVACITDEIVPVDFDNEKYFEDVSWTISYKVTDGTWGSYFSFKPDYYLSNVDHFRVGFNYGQDKETVWNHNLNNSSFQVFQGRKEPFIVEYPVVNENVNKVLNTISLNIEAKRWQNQWDYAQNASIGFNEVVVYNNTNNSGVLWLDEQRTLGDVKNYPQTTPSYQKILYTMAEGKQTFNYFFNRVRNERNNIPQWLWDKNRIIKTVNQDAVSFKGKTSLERMRGETFLVQLTQDAESRFQITLKNSVSDETVY